MAMDPSNDWVELLGPCCKCKFERPEMVNRGLKRFPADAGDAHRASRGIRAMIECIKDKTKLRNDVAMHSVRRGPEVLLSVSPPWAVHAADDPHHAPFSVMARRTRRQARAAGAGTAATNSNDDDAEANPSPKSAASQRIRGASAPRHGKYQPRDASGGGDQTCRPQGQ